MHMEGKINYIDLKNAFLRGDSNAFQLYGLRATYNQFSPLFSAFIWWYSLKLYFTLIKSLLTVELNVKEIYNSIIFKI